MKRIDDLEFRWSVHNNSYELIRWVKVKEVESCFVIAFFRKGSEGCDIELVGDRPFQVMKDEIVWEMLRYGQAIVDAEHELEWSTNNA